MSELREAELRLIAGTVLGWHWRLPFACPCRLSSQRAITLAQLRA